MKLVCPYCNSECEAEIELSVGQRVICPICQRKFTYGIRAASSVANKMIVTEKRTNRPMPRKVANQKTAPRRRIVKPRLFKFELGCGGKLIIALALGVFCFYISNSYRHGDLNINEPKHRQIAKVEDVSDEDDQPKQIEREEDVVSLTVKAKPNNRHEEDEDSKRHKRLLAELGSLGFIRNSKGIIIGMMGHKLGEIHQNEEMFDRSKGTWELHDGLCTCEGLLRKSIFYFTNFDYTFHYEENLPIRLMGIELDACLGSSFDRESVQRIVLEMRGEIEKKFGIRLDLVSRASDGDGRINEKYVMQQGFFEERETLPEIRFIVVENKAGKYLMRLELDVNIALFSPTNYK